MMKRMATASEPQPDSTDATPWRSTSISMTCCPSVPILGQYAIAADVRGEQARQAGAVPPFDARAPEAREQ